MKKLSLFLAALLTATVMNLNAATPDYLYFTSRKADGTGTVQLNKKATSLTATFQYSKDRINWTEYTWPNNSGTGGYVITLSNVGDTVFFRALGAKKDGKNATLSYVNDYFTFVFGANDSIVAGGNVMSLYDATCEQDTMTVNGFTYLLNRASQLVSVLELKLPATKLAVDCYCGLFQGCTALTQVPELPADSLAAQCYRSMFSGCTALTQAPELKATKLATSCYNGMFGTCYSLETAPALPVTTLEIGCYSYMFKNCTTLTKAPELKATKLAEMCYMNMFQGCTALTQAPELPATTLAKSCYNNMFQNCTALTQAPELKATKLDTTCYSNMFKNCSKLEVDTFSLICDGAELVVPSVSGDAPLNWNKDMFNGCKGTAVGNIQLGGHYCIREYGKPRPIYGRKVTNGNFGTICLDKQFIAMEGVEGLYVPASKDANYLYCEPVEVKDVKAGYAYIFKANADSVTFAFEGEAVTAAVEANSMLGWLEADKTIDNAFLTTYANYSLLGIPAGGTEQQIVKPTVGSEILKNCAMINLTTVQGGTPAPERRCIRLGVNTPTGMNQLTDSPVNQFTKMMINGQLIIMKDGKMFNAQGQEL